MKKSISVTLVALLFLQSCVVYQSVPTPLVQAHGKGKGTSIYKGEEFKFKNIYLNNGDYYVESLAKVKNSEGVYHWVGYREYIDESMIESIYLKNGTKSGWATAGLLVGLTVGAFAIPILVGFFAYLFGGG
jgi:phage-related tail fiber protein